MQSGLPLRLFIVFFLVNVGVTFCACSTPKNKRYVPDVCYLSAHGLFCALEKEAIALPAAEGWACMKAEELKLFLESERCP